MSTSGDKYTRGQLDQLASKLYCAVICDILDGLGYRNQALDGSVAPLDDGYSLIGFARTLLTHEVYECPEKPYETEIAAVDSFLPGDVAVVAMTHSRNNGFWGELMATAAIARGARGVVLDGPVRDIHRLRVLGGEFKVFAAGRNPLDSHGRCIVAAYDCPVLCGGTLVHPGDMIFADVDGVVAIPKAVIETTIEKALHKASEENAVRADLLSGMYLKDAFAKHGVL